MVSKWEAVRETFERAHDDLFDSVYSAEFFNYSAGSYDPDEGEMTGQSRQQIADVEVEIVPPAIDSTVRNEGTSFSWDTSIRFPLEIDEPTDTGWGNNWGTNWGSTRLTEAFVPLGVDSQRPTEVEITDTTDDSRDRFELHGYSYERGSGMVMCRLVEQ